jgi:hypothetical protein
MSTVHICRLSGGLPFLPHLLGIYIVAARSIGCNTETWTHTLL